MEFVVDEGDISKCKVEESDEVTIKHGQVLVKVVKTAFTSNVVSYALGGHALGYFKFFPSKNGAAIPTWGIGVVVASRHEAVREGERLYGYFAYGSQFVALTVSNVLTGSFVDLSEHRKDLSIVYNTYNRLNSGEDIFYSPEAEDLMILLRPLFLTSWLLMDFCEQSVAQDAAAGGGAPPTQIILTSASSKTAYGLAYLLKLCSDTPFRVLGLTSDRNIKFVAGLGVYDEVVPYEDIEGCIAPVQGAKTIMVDMSGNGPVLRRVVDRVPDVQCSLVGATHWEEGLADLPGRFFFAPAHAQTTIKRLGQESFNARVSQDWRAFIEHVSSKGWCRIVKRHGAQAVLETYRGALKEGVDPSEGVVTSMFDSTSRM